jgi:hypothetical protein
MPRYIPLSFLLLGWVFYEMSGGADFAPEPRTEVATVEEKVPVEVTRLERVRQERADETVARAAADAQTGESAASRNRQERVDAQIARQDRVASEQSDERGDATRPDQDTDQLQQLRAGLRSTLPVFTSVTGTGGEQVQTISLSGLGGAARTPQPDPAPQPSPAVRAPVAASADIREVVATRVNMRAGPGTSHDIIERLSRGQSVEVLGNDGQGWLRLRTLPGDRVGWIAERLIGPAQD